MISLSHFEYLSLVWGDGGRPFLDSPPTPPCEGGEMTPVFLYHFRECTKMVNLKAYFVRKVEKLTKYEIPNI